MTLLWNFKLAPKTNPVAVGVGPSEGENNYELRVDQIYRRL